MATRHDPPEGQEPSLAFWDQASHDLRQPVQSLQLLTQVFARHAETEQVRQAVEHMRRVVTNLGRMQDALVQLSRLECGRTVAARRPVDLRAVAGGIVRELAGVARERGLGLQASGLDAPAEADPGWLDLILRSMVLIALDEGGHGEVAITGEQSGDAIAISVRFPDGDSAGHRAAAIFVEAADGRTVPGPGYLGHLCGMLGYGLDLTAERPGERRFTVTLPRAPSSP